MFGYFETKNDSKQNLTRRKMLLNGKQQVLKKQKKNKNDTKL